jgi:S1-C subfamily serine protease
VVEDPETKILAVEDVFPGSPGAKAGLKPGDVILQVEGKALASIDAVEDLMKTLKAGQTITVRIRRGKKELDVKVTLSERPGE